MVRAQYGKCCHDHGAAAASYPGWWSIRGVSADQATNRHPGRRLSAYCKPNLMLALHVAGKLSILFVLSPAVRTTVATTRGPVIRAAIGGAFQFPVVLSRVPGTVATGLGPVIRDQRRSPSSNQAWGSC
jgi:hypothetical protein